MAFKDDIAAFTAAEIVKALGCPRGTAHHWLIGEREPPAWQQPHWLVILERSKTAAEKRAKLKHVDNGPATDAPASARAATGWRTAEELRGRLN